MEYTPPAPLSRTEIDKGWAKEIHIHIRHDIGWITILKENSNGEVTVSLMTANIPPADMPLYIQACVLAYGEASRLSE